MHDPEFMKFLAGLFDADAADYEGQQGHGMILPGEEDAWRQDILEAIQFRPGATCLDAACGTGVLTRMLADWMGPTGHVVATDFSAASLSLNKNRLPPETSGRVSFVQGDLHDSKLLDSSAHRSFDYIACRQGTVILYDPITAFGNWYQWLNPGGQLVVLEGLWLRRSWEEDGTKWGEVIDRLPLSCVQTRATIPYLLRQVGFTVDHRWLDRVNKVFASAVQPFESPRYIVVAHKPQS